jgi:hypothetical protein
MSLISLVIRNIKVETGLSASHALMARNASFWKIRKSCWTRSGNVDGESICSPLCQKVSDTNRKYSRPAKAKQAMKKDVTLREVPFHNTLVEGIRDRVLHLLIADEAVAPPISRL